jgi:hypothetical protein
MQLNLARIRQFCADAMARLISNNNGNNNRNQRTPHEKGGFI